MLHQRVSEKLDSGFFAIFVENVEELEVDILQNRSHYFLTLGYQYSFFSYLLRLHQKEYRIGVSLIAQLGW